jgi:phosphoglycerate dehydrogenase-like enzyme
VSATQHPDERPDVLVTYDPGDGDRAALAEALAPHAGVRFLTDAAGDARGGWLAVAEVLITWSLDRDLEPGELRSAERLQLIQLMSAGADTVDFAALPPGVTVAANVGAFADPMAEHALGMALALAKRLPTYHAQLAAGEYPLDPETIALRAGVAAIVGFGGIGRTCAALFRALGMRIHAMNTSGATDDEVEFVGGPADLERVLGGADVVVLAVPLTRHTRGLIGARELSWMKRTAVLINVARAAIVDETALYDHLVATPEFSAGLDVWWEEPERGETFRPRLPFLDLPNVLGSPHNSGIVPGMTERAAAFAARNVVRFLAGKPPRGVQRPEDYSSSARIE